MDTTTLLTGYARCSTDEQDLTTQHQVLQAVGVPVERIYMDKVLTVPIGNAPAWIKRWPPSAPATPWWCESWTAGSKS